jgi:hypothetical protein
MLVRVTWAVVVVAALWLLAASGPVGAASTRHCGDLPANSRHNDIYNVTTRGLSCRTARRATLRLFNCPLDRSCRVVGRTFRCHNAGQDEGVDERCVSGKVFVRFQTGV